MNQSIQIGATGLLGWQILQRNESRYMEVVAKDPQIRRETEYFANGIGALDSASDLVSDYRMLNVALKAFGLEDDVANKAFIRKVLESDLSDDRSLANRLGDKRYLRLAEAFGYGDPAGSNNTGPAIIERISQAYLQSEFERRVGEGDETLRLALNARRELQQMQSRESSDQTLWYEVLGNQPLRTVFEGALGFPASYGKLPIDRQHSLFSTQARKFLGSDSFRDLGEPVKMEKIITQYLVRAGISEAISANRFSTALTLLIRR